MCGRYSLTKTPNDIAGRLDVTLPAEGVRVRYNVAPGQWVCAFRIGTGQSCEITSMKWGLIPSWSKDPSIANRLINARSESVDTKSSFKAAWKRRRCLIPADGFYEWKKIGRKKQPYRFLLNDESVFAFGGLWETWGASDGSEVDTLTILTTRPNSMVAEIHDRMPVIIEPEHYREWLLAPDGDSLKDLLVPINPTRMRVYAVEPTVNSPSSDTKSSIEPLNAEEIQGELFS